jgi:uncharacterized protein YukE
MPDESRVDPASLRAVAHQMAEHAEEVESHGQALGSNTAGSVGRGPIGEVVESVVKRGMKIVEHDVSAAVKKFYRDVGTVLNRSAEETERNDRGVASEFGRLGHGARDERAGSRDIAFGQRSPRGARVTPTTGRGLDRAGGGDLADPRGASAGYRRSAFNDLRPEEMEQVKREFQEIGGDPNMLRFNTGVRTGYIDGANEIQVNGDVFPSGPPDPLQPNATMSSRAVLAHELGHQNFDVAKDHPDYLPPGTPEDEMRTSRWAAEHVPGLTHDERRFLILDARSRGVPLPSDSFILRILYGITEDPVS